MIRSLNITRDQRWQFSFFVLFAIIIISVGHYQNHRFDDIKEVSITEAKTLIDGGALVIDVRDEDKYNARHLAGAISLPLAILKTGIPTILAHAKDLRIVVYCTDGVTTGPEGTQVLNQAGYKQAVNMKAGIGGWADSGLPVLTK